MTSAAHATPLSSSEQQACAIAGRTLSRAEWGDALSGRDYQPACSG
jgi:hypothetical protein